LTANAKSVSNLSIYYWMLASTYRDKHLDVDTCKASAYRCFAF
jgi:hypothetical protein